MFYEIPANLDGELNELESPIERFRKGELDATSLRARRVPFGCYEQRKDGTYMVRIRTTGGALTPMQLRTIASLSAQYGGEAVHITTRQEFQIHDVALENVVPVMRELRKAGLSTRGGGGNTVRNIMISPDAGVSRDEVFDPSPYAFALTSRLTSEADSWLLPRKYKITFSNSRKDTAYAQFNDLGFIAEIKDGVKGFKVYVAGGMGSKPEVAHLLHEFIPVEDVYVVTEAVKHLFGKYGNRKNKHSARLRFLWKDLGEARFRELYQQELEQVRQSASLAFEPAHIDACLSTPSISPIEDSSAEFDIWKHRYCFQQRQTGLSSIVIPLLLGNIKNNDAIALASFLDGFGNDVIRATFGQNLRLRNIPDPYLGNVFAVAKDISELANAPALLGNSIACTGADTCKLGICLPKGALRAIKRKLERSGLPLDQFADFTINLSGCPNTCGQHMIADLGFYGKVARIGQRMYPAYGVVAGAVIADGAAKFAQNLDRVSARDLPDFVVDVLSKWLEKKQDFVSFASYVETGGAADIHAIADRYRTVPDFEDDKNYYYDWGAQDAFSLVGKGVGECSAGLFDLIEVDLKEIEKVRHSLSGAVPKNETGDALYRIALCASRMLLITRGIEASTDASVFANFSKHFIESGLVDARFLPVVQAASHKDLTLLLQRRADVLALADAVIELYASMDNSLHFPAETADAASPKRTEKICPVLERDYRGVTCPMNFVKVKLDLARMKDGERLSVLLDDGPPIENVPRSVAQEGHKVLEQQKVADHWVVVIEKK
jgi:sulfite reductase (ferredoxin)